MSIEEYYKFSRTLGQGGFAVVKLATAHKDSKQWACKIIKKTALKESDMSALKNEVNIMKICEHKNIVHLHEVFDTKQNLYLVMEVMRGGELFDRVVTKDHYSEREAQVAIIQLLKALHYCHERNIVHRDLKPENLLYASPDDGDELKLADFGLASIVNQGELLHAACGTPNYVAPEILKTRGEGKLIHGYGKEVDIWSAGVILYILLCGFPPFYEDDSHVLFEQIENCSYEFISPYWDDISPSAKDLIKNMITLEPSQRFSAEQCMKHNFLADVAPTNQLSYFQDNMKRFNARRRLKGSFRAIVASRRLSIASGKK